MLKEHTRIRTIPWSNICLRDVALQFVGNLFEFFLSKHNTANPENIKQLTIIGATSATIGLPSIYGLRERNIRVFILYPNGRISTIQEEQMTTIQDKNIQTLVSQVLLITVKTLSRKSLVYLCVNQKYNLELLTVSIGPES